MLTDEFFLGTKLYREKLSELCIPLKNYLGITNALYINIDKHGSAFSIFNNRKWAERFVDQGYYQVDPLMVDPNHMDNGFLFDNMSDNQEFHDKMIRDGIVNFNWHHGFVYTEKSTSGGYFGFAFGTTKDNHHIVTRLINEACLIKKFIRKLNRALIACTQDLQKNRMDFAALKGEAFHTQKGIIFHEKQAIKHKMKLLNDSGFMGYDAEDCLSSVSLSPQELNCLRIYLTTQSLQAVSKDTGLAITTTTSYIENIKKKLRCENKHELFEKAGILEALGQI